jgi:glutamine cyclotransferase
MRGSRKVRGNPNRLRKISNCQFIAAGLVFPAMMIHLALWLVSLVAPSVAAAAPAPEAPPQPTAFQRCGYEVIAEYPHDNRAFTQGLFWHDGHLYEGTGQYGESRIARLDLKTGKADKVQPLTPRDFGEGITRWGDQIIGVTWQGGKGYRWRLSDLKPLGEFSYEGEGWGVTMVGDQLALSDGTNQLRFFDPATMAEQRRTTVRISGQPLAMINELETIDGKIWANVWMTNVIVRIRPDDGAVDQVVDFTGLKERAGAYGHDSVLNGIAWDAAGQRLFVTGKYWPKLFEVKVAGCQFPNQQAAAR